MDHLSGPKSYPQTAKVQRSSSSIDIDDQPQAHSKHQLNKQHFESGGFKESRFSYYAVQCGTYFACLYHLCICFLYFHAVLMRLTSRVPQRPTTAQEVFQQSTSVLVTNHKLIQQNESRKM